MLFIALLGCFLKELGGEELKGHHTSEGLKLEF